MATTKLMTAEDLAQLPDNANRYDLIEGVLHAMSPAGWGHGFIGLEIAAEIRNYVKAHRLGMTFAAETGFLLARDPDTVLAPDVAFVRRDRLPIPDSSPGFAPIAPDLVVEVRSPSDRRSDVMTKIETYLYYGVAVVWLVEPAKQQVIIFRPGQEPEVSSRRQTVDGGAVLPGFRLPLRDIFPDD